MKQDSPSARKQHPMQVVTRRTGLTADLLRAWEKRYQAVIPGRSDGGHRLYSDEDIHRLALLRRAVRAGRSIGRVAGMGLPELEELIRSDTEAVGPESPGSAAPPGQESDGGSTALLQGCLAALDRLDVAALESALARATLMMSSVSVVRNILVPLMTTVGNGWQHGELRIVHEHLASSVVRSFLGHLARSQGLPDSAPRMVSTTPAGQIHEMGALMVAATAIAEGWNVVYLGANLPAEEITEGVRRTGARVAALSIVYPADDPRLPAELSRLRALLPPEVRIVAGGSAASAYEKTLREIGASLAGGIDTLGSLLDLARDPA